MSMLRVLASWDCGPGDDGYLVRKVQFKHSGEVGYDYAIGYGKVTNEVYPTFDYALAAAIAERHTGKRGASGTGVGTAADWFMRMIQYKQGDGE